MNKYESSWKNRDMKYLSEKEEISDLKDWAVILVLWIFLFLVMPSWIAP